MLRLIYICNTNQDKLRQIKTNINMQTHKNIQKLLKNHLPKHYKKKICDVLAISYNHKNTKKIYRVKNGLEDNPEILKALVDLAVNQRKEKTRINKKVK